MAGKYDFGYEVYHGSTVEWALNTVQPNSTVLEFGPFNGNLTKHLKENLTCQVDIVELDQEAGEAAQQFARDALIGEKEGNIESYVWEKKYAGRQYDYIIFLDVIEHLIPTEEILLRIQPFLKENGAVLLSIPNIAYNGVIINLLNNRFPYTDRGLLDCTHLRFFAYESILALAKKLNYGASISALQLPIADSETNTSYSMVPEQVAHYLQQRKYSNVYQYLVILKKSGNKNKTTELVLENVDNRILTAVYIQTPDDNDFSEAKKAWTYTQAGLKLHVELDLSTYGMIRDIRLDPMECPCYLKQISVTAQTLDGQEVELPVLRTNGEQIDDTVLFMTDDPQLYFAPQNIAYQSLTFSCEIISYDREEVSQLYELHLWNQSCFHQLQEDFQKLQERLLQEQSAHVVTQQALEQEQSAHTATQRVLEQEQSAHTATQQALEQEQLAHEKLKEKFEKEYNLHQITKEKLNKEQASHKQTQSILSKEVKLRETIQAEAEQLKSDLQRILYLKEQSEKRLYLIESSKAWHTVQKFRKIKDKLLGR